VFRNNEACDNGGALSLCAARFEYGSAINPVTAYMDAGTVKLDIDETHTKAVILDLSNR
jgi:hypothetical protein